MYPSWVKHSDISENFEEENDFLLVENLKLQKELENIKQQLELETSLLEEVPLFETFLLMFLFYFLICGHSRKEAFFMKMTVRLLKDWLAVNKNAKFYKRKMIN